MSIRFHKSISYLPIFFLFLAANSTVSRETTFDLKQPLVLIHKKEYSRAIPLLEEAEKREKDPQQKKRILYLLAAANFKADNLAESRKIFASLKKSYPELGDYIRYNLGKIHLQKEELPQAIEHFKKLLKEYPESRLFSHSIFKIGKAYFELKEYGKAIFHLNQFLRKYRRQKKAREALFLLAESFRLTNRLKEAGKIFWEIYLDYPLSSFSVQAQERLAELKKNKKVKIARFPVLKIIRRSRILINGGRIKKGLKELEGLIPRIKKQALLKEKVHFLKGVALLNLKEKEGVKQLEEFIRKYPRSRRASEVLYRLGKHFWYKNQNELSLKYHQKNLKNYPRTRWTAKGLYVIGRIYEEEDKPELALEYFTRLGKDFPAYAVAQEASFKIGWIYYQAEKYSEAAAVFKRHLKKYPYSSQEKTILYWLGVCLEKSDQRDKALTYFLELVQDYPYSYYGLKERKKLNRGGKKTNLSSSAKEEDKLFVILRQDPFSSSFLKQLNQKQRSHLKRLQELSALEFFEDAKIEAQYLPSSRPDKPGYLLWLSNLFFQARDYLNGFKILNEVLGDYKKMEEISSIFWKKYYPLPAYYDYIKASAREEKINPLLILGLIRQESGFNPRAVSPAGAKGLMQLMNSTGKKEFQKRKKSSKETFRKRFRSEMLFAEDLNIALGTQHLASLLKNYAGDLILSLAAYNAGKKKVEEWLEKYKPDTREEFVEIIPYRETRNYVKKVLRNYWNYQRIYGG